MLVKRVTETPTVSGASVYGGMTYFGGVSADGVCLKCQTEAVLNEYGRKLDALGLKRTNIVNAFVMLDKNTDTTDFFTVWNGWAPKGSEPAMTVIRTGLPANALVELSLFVANEDTVERVQLENGSKMVKYNHVAYYSGQNAGGLMTLTEQTKAVMGGYDRMLAACGLKKENILNGNIYVQDIDMQDEYENVWIGWTYEGHKPSGTMVEGKPLDSEHLLTLNLTFADSGEVLDIYRHNPGANCCRYVKHNGVAYFTGHCCIDPAADTLYKQTKSIMERFVGIFAEAGFKKENILIANAYISDITLLPQFEAAWDEWVDRDNAPARTACGTKLLSPDFFLEFTLTVAIDN